MARYVAGIREKKKQQTRDALATAAVTLVMTEGPEAATIAAISERANVSSRTFHNYFPHRDAAIRHYLEHLVDSLIKQIQELPAGMHPVDVMRTLTMKHVEENPEHQQSYMQLETLMINIRNSPHLDVVGESYRDMQKLGGAISAYTRGELSSIDSYLLVHACVGAMRGIELAQLNAKSCSQSDVRSLLDNAFDSIKLGFCSSR